MCHRETKPGNDGINLSAPRIAMDLNLPPSAFTAAECSSPEIEKKIRIRVR